MEEKQFKDSSFNDCVAMMASPYLCDVKICKHKTYKEIKANAKNWHWKHTNNTTGK